VLLDLSPLNVHGAQDALVVTTSFLREHPVSVEGIVAGLIEASAFAQSAKGKPAVLDTIKTELKIVDDAAAEAGLVQLSKIIVRKPYPSVENLRNMQRIMRIADPKAAGYPAGSAARYGCDTFNYTYTSLLKVVHETFNGSPNRLGTAIGMMESLKEQALTLMTIDSGLGGKAGPSFEYQPTNP
jgi:hypothetical protein